MEANLAAGESDIDGRSESEISIGEGDGADLAVRESGSREDGRVASVRGIVDVYGIGPRCVSPELVIVSEGTRPISDHAVEAWRVGSISRDYGRIRPHDNHVKWLAWEEVSASDGD